MTGESWGPEVFETGDEEDKLESAEDDDVDSAERALEKDFDVLPAGEDDDDELNLSEEVDHLLADDDELEGEKEGHEVDDGSDEVGDAEELSLDEAVRGLEGDEAEEAIENWLSANKVEGEEDLDTAVHAAENDPHFAVRDAEEAKILANVDVERVVDGEDIDEDGDEDIFGEDFTDDLGEELGEGSEEVEEVLEE